MILSLLLSKWFFAAILVGIIGILIRKGMREAGELKLSCKELKLACWPTEAEGCRMLHLSDLHLKANSKLPERILKLTEEARPDYVVITGDLLPRGNKGQKEAWEFLRQMAARRPIFLVPGNEDRGSFLPQPVDEWPATGATVLLNRAVNLGKYGKRCWLAGVDDPHRGRDDLTRALEGIPEGEAVILLAHSPEIIKRSGIERACVIFCGHTHGGQMCLPGGKPLHIHTPLPLRYGRGEHWVGTGNTKLVVSRGAGTTRLPLRLWCPPEVTLWILKSGK